MGSPDALGRAGRRSPGRGGAVIDVDYIGIDIDDWYGTLSSFQTERTEAASFAQQMQLPLTIPEWGLANSVDDPGFVNLIHANCDTAACDEEGLFSGVGSGPGTSILKDPNALAAYKQASAERFAQDSLGGESLRLRRQ